MKNFVIYNTLKIKTLTSRYVILFANKKIMFDLSLSRTTTLFSRKDNDAIYDKVSLQEVTL